LAEALSVELGAVLVPMDGFHLDNRVLDARGLRQCKGAPETFDLRGFDRLLAEIAAGGEVVCPLFDRDRDLAIAGARVVPANCRMVVVEGNYLLFDAPGWRDLATFWSLSVFLEVPEPVLLSRLMQRWLVQGLSPDDARRRAEGNDMPNARMIGAHRLPADLTLT